MEEGRKEKKRNEAWRSSGQICSCSAAAAKLCTPAMLAFSLEMPIKVTSFNMIGYFRAVVAGSFSVDSARRQKPLAKKCEENTVEHSHTSNKEWPPLLFLFLLNRCVLNGGYFATNRKSFLVHSTHYINLSFAQVLFRWVNLDSCSWIHQSLAAKSTLWLFMSYEVQWMIQDS